MTKTRSSWLLIYTIFDNITTVDNAVLAGLLAMTLAPLQRILHAAARTVLDRKLGDHVTPALQELHWLPITERIQYKLCLLVHKMFVGHAPDYIVSLLMPASDIPSLRRCVRRVTVTWSYKEQ